MRILKMIIAAIMGWNKQPEAQNKYDLVVKDGRGSKGKIGRISYAGRNRHEPLCDIFHGCDIAVKDLSDLFERLEKAYKTTDFRAFKGVDNGHSALWLEAYAKSGVRVAKVRLVKSSTTEYLGGDNYIVKSTRLEVALIRMGA